jgi:serine/threonine protein phosphatase PrpC
VGNLLALAAAADLGASASHFGALFGDPGMRGHVLRPPALPGCQVSCITHRGTRSENQDRYGVWGSGAATLMVLADGMGGHARGELAAEVAVAAVGEQFAALAAPRLADPDHFLLQAFGEAQDKVLRCGDGLGLGENDQPRTTLVAALVQDGRIWWAHCGDSRVYVAREGALLVRTRDHSYVELRDVLADDHGVIGDGVSRSVLFSCIGSPGRPLIDTGGPLRLDPLDAVLLCSDGLWDGLSDLDILHQITGQPIVDALASLASLALATGGPRCDNITAVALGASPA